MLRGEADEGHSMAERVPDTHHLMLIHVKGVSRIVVARKKFDETE